MDKSNVRFKFFRGVAGCPRREGSGSNLLLERGGDFPLFFSFLFFLVFYAEKLYILCINIQKGLYERKTVEIKSY